MQGRGEWSAEVWGRGRWLTSPGKRGKSAAAAEHSGERKRRPGGAPVETFGGKRTAASRAFKGCKRGSQSRKHRTEFGRESEMIFGRDFRLEVRDDDVIDDVIPIFIFLF